MTTLQWCTIYWILAAYDRMVHHLNHADTHIGCPRGKALGGVLRLGMSAPRLRDKIKCPCYLCRGAKPPAQQRTVTKHLRVQQELLDGLLAASDLSLAPAAIADAAAASHDAAAYDANSNDYVDGNPINQLLNWDAEITVLSSNSHILHKTQDHTQNIGLLGCRKRAGDHNEPLLKLFTPCSTGQRGTLPHRSHPAEFGILVKAYSPKTTTWATSGS
jgi:hypothetical protein